MALCTGKGLCRQEEDSVACSLAVKGETVLSWNVENKRLRNRREQPCCKERSLYFGATCTEQLAGWCAADETERVMILQDRVE
jgi:hypothetical protein